MSDEAIKAVRNINAGNGITKADVTTYSYKGWQIAVRPQSPHRETEVIVSAPYEALEADALVAVSDLEDLLQGILNDQRGS